MRCKRPPQDLVAVSVQAAVLPRFIRPEPEIPGLSIPGAVAKKSNDENKKAAGVAANGKHIL